MNICPAGLRKDAGQRPGEAGPFISAGPLKNPSLCGSGSLNLTSATRTLQKGPRGPYFFGPPLLHRRRLR